MLYLKSTAVLCRNQEVFKSGRPGIQGIADVSSLNDPLAFRQSEVTAAGLWQIHYLSEFTINIIIIQESQIVHFSSLAWILQYWYRQGGLGWREAFFQRMYSNTN